jgi:hypothetical protein
VEQEDGEVKTRPSAEADSPVGPCMSVSSWKWVAKRVGAPVTCSRISIRVLELHASIFAKFGHNQGLH